MRSFRPPRRGRPPVALPALLRATHLLGLALGSAFGRLRESGATAGPIRNRRRGRPAPKYARSRQQGAGPSDPGKGSRRPRRLRTTVRQSLIEGSASPC